MYEWNKTITKDHYRIIVINNNVIEINDNNNPTAFFVRLGVVASETMLEVATSLVVASLAVEDAVTVEVVYKYFKNPDAPVVVSPHW